MNIPKQEGEKENPEAFFMEISLFFCKKRKKIHGNSFHFSYARIMLFKNRTGAGPGVVSKPSGQGPGYSEDEHGFS